MLASKSNYSSLTGSKYSSLLSYDKPFFKSTTGFSSRNFSVGKTGGATSRSVSLGSSSSFRSTTRLSDRSSPVALSRTSSSVRTTRASTSSAYPSKSSYLSPPSSSLGYGSRSSSVTSSNASVFSVSPVKSISTRPKFRAISPPRSATLHKKLSSSFGPDYELVDLKKEPVKTSPIVSRFSTTTKTSSGSNRVTPCQKYSRHDPNLPPEDHAYDQFEADRLQNLLDTHYDYGLDKDWRYQSKSTRKINEEIKSWISRTTFNNVNADNFKCECYDFFQGSMRGMRATKEIQPGEAIMWMPVQNEPVSTVINARNVLEDATIKKFLQSSHPDDLEYTLEHLFFIFLIAHRKKKANSKYYEYIDGLPDSYDTPIMWDDHQIRLLSAEESKLIFDEIDRVWEIFAVIKGFSVSTYSEEKIKKFGHVFGLKTPSFSLNHWKSPV